MRVVLDISRTALACTHMRPRKMYTAFLAHVSSIHSRFGPIPGTGFALPALAADAMSDRSLWELPRGSQTRRGERRRQGRCWQGRRHQDRHGAGRGHGRRHAPGRAGRALTQRCATGPAWRHAPRPLPCAPARGFLLCGVRTSLAMGPGPAAVTAWHSVRLQHLGTPVVTILAARMTRGRRNWLSLQRMKRAFTTPCRP